MNLYKGVDGLLIEPGKIVKDREVEGLKWGPKVLALDPDVDHPQPQPKPVPIATLLLPSSVTNLVCYHGYHQFTISVQLSRVCLSAARCYRRR